MIYFLKQGQFNMRIWGNSVNFMGITIYPVTMEDAMDFYENISCLLIEKHKIQDARILKMSYLDFMHHVVIEYLDKFVFLKLKRVLELVLKDQKYKFEYADNGLVYLHINDVVLSGFEFEHLKNIILEENVIKEEKEILDVDLEEALMEAQRDLANKSESPATFEERVIALHCVSGIPYQDIKKYTLYQFSKSLERYSVIKNFDAYSALMAEHGESSSIQHWLSHIGERSKYADVIMAKDSLDKMTSSDMFTKN